RVVAKGKSDNNGKLIVHNVYVGKEDTIDKLSFIPDRNNFDESNFELSLNQYESFTNIQKKHKSTKELKLLQAYFSFNGSKLSLEYEYEVSNLKANIYKDTIELIPTHNLKDTRFRQYIKYAYMVFDITDSNIDEKTSNITIANRAMLGLKNLGNSGNNKYEIRESWREKIVIFFAYFDKQEKTPFFKALFIHKPIVILDLGNSGAIPLEYEQNSMKRVDIVYDIIQMIEARLKNIATLIKLQKNSDEIIGLDERVRKVNAIKQNTQSKNLLFLSLHIDSEATKSASGMRCFYNDKAYAEQEKRFIKHLKEIYPVTNNTYFENKSNLYLTKFVNVASVLVTLGFISNDDDKARLNNKTQRKAIANKLFLAISNYLRKNNK
ncbi:N-acetylmuramoyl-L-alanine amidase family protein, partial [Helicobacter bilis]